MLAIVRPILKYFAFFIVGLFLAFPISAMFGAISLFFSYLPLIWQILWRSGLILMMLTSIALFIEGLNNGSKNNV
jgi:glucose-6-phosphate-specific signal transduction histidine kinase